MHALTWLEVFLSSWEKTVLVVSHDRGFLNRTTTATMFVHNKRLRYYGGNYDTYLRVRAEHRAAHAAHQKQNERRQARAREEELRQQLEASEKQTSEQAEIIRREHQQAAQAHMADALERQQKLEQQLHWQQHRPPLGLCRLWKKSGVRRS